MIKHASIDFKFVFTLTASLSLFIIYISQWTTMIADPTLRTGTDFIAFYAAGRVAQQYGFSNVYDIDLQQQAEEQAVDMELKKGQVLLYNHMPFLIPVLTVLVSENYVASFVGWALLMLSVYAAGSFLLVRITEQSFDRLLFIGALLFFPFFQSILLGQDSALLFLGVIIWASGMIRGNDWLAGIGLVLTTVRPHICLTLTISMLVLSHGAAWRVILLESALAVGSFLLVGLNGASGFLQILQLSAGGTWFGMNEAAMFNLIGLTIRLLPMLDSKLIHLLGWMGYLFGFAVVFLIWRQPTLSFEAKISLSVVTALLLSPHLHFHDLTLLAIPFFYIPINKENKATLLLGTSLILLILQPLYFVLPYILYAGFAWYFTFGNKAHKLLIS